MAFLHVPPTWRLSENAVTAESVFLNRRRFLKTMIGGGLAMATLPLAGCKTAQAPIAEELTGTKALRAIANPAFQDAGRPVTGEVLAATYNNFYEFGSSKNIWQAAQALPTDPWTLEVTGLVNNPKTYDLDDLLTRFPLEERIYRFRCVEAWAMVVPWLGFPMNALLRDVDPKSSAKFVRFTSYFDPAVTKGPSFPPARFLPFPYTEGLRIEEMANDLAFFAVGIYGHTLPEQHGAPIRMVIPWKYGFKGAKSLVKIEFLDTQPATYWNTLSPNEYKFEANVEPDVPHPRWSQAKERLIGPGNQYSWEEVPTLLYNGYGEFVADLYA
ncbi:protein-methionine-sulfoxide reductase catalytic subunit MsrP [Thermoleptolyngbya sichuanensis XZ-Cy5]|uniref:protein-methionine-sulfoxide reductase catalytic subunit MsrP n=1 Tax=Thermoleptolyngbya sichuanensis TaxID=2885951 RepID=UPI00240D0FC3|nr:protein-methionine-sulfoxide reductase catalytic subunit MsrP [Thermoleptolyngbya sichuanensis]MDG2615674.1 protein-methionine-sulfoxide reductase catalytic subunit MsrP [Thermoleptolyngbya sichuanensis XZ-Cy5]